jgi:hypothetical protein
VPPHRYAEAIERLWGEDQAPADDQDFDGEGMVSAHDWDWPPWTAQLMLNWVPDQIQDQFGDVGASRISGDALMFDPGEESELVAAFEGAGYTCVRDDRLVGRASGQTYG